MENAVQNVVAALFQNHFQYKKIMEIVNLIE
jgi:hypothetical protein